jgi:iron complex outermembrane receptor protein
VFTLRGSATRQDHTHQFGSVLERDGHGTAFGEVSLMGSAGPHTWVAGGALAYEAYRSDDVPRFDYTYVVPGFFAQDDFTVTPTLTLAGSLRIDAHNEFGAFVSPRVSALVRAGTPWTVRLSAGRGHFAPTPFIEESEAIGLTPIAPLAGVRPEAADSFSVDVTWSHGPLEITGTAFTSRIQDALTGRESGRADFPIEIVNTDGPTLTRGTELIARYHREDPELDVILTHMFLWSTEPEPFGPERRDVALNPRHSATFDLLKQIGPARIGFEVFYTGRQVLDDNPYRDSGFPYVLFGGLIDFGIGASRVYVNVENLGDVRQTREDRLVRPSQTAGGRWTVDAWAPLEGRTVNAGIRWRF